MGSMNFDVGVELKYIALCYVRTVVEAEFLSKREAYPSSRAISNKKGDVVRSVIEELEHHTDASRNVMW